MICSLRSALPRGGATALCHRENDVSHDGARLPISCKFPDIYRSAALALKAEETETRL
jgi:hypothetical protein